VRTVAVQVGRSPAGPGSTVAAARDENGIDQTIDDYDSYSPDVKQGCIKQIDAHGYDGKGTGAHSGSDRGVLRDLASSHQATL